jgi:hypothetical protein
MVEEIKGLMKTFIVLGMHRSATSLAAMGLYNSNVWMGEPLMGKNHTNIYGHFEDINFVQMNDKILQSAGGSWDNPPPEYEILKAGELHSNSLKELVKSKEREPFWGWKDPRTTLTIKCYMPYLNNPHFITCLRHPKEVAWSLWKRDKTQIADGLKLGKIYNKRMIDFLQDYSKC